MVRCRMCRAVLLLFYSLCASSLLAILYSGSRHGRLNVYFKDLIGPNDYSSDPTSRNAVTVLVRKPASSRTSEDSSLLTNDITPPIAKRPPSSISAKQETESSTLTTPAPTFVGKIVSGIVNRINSLSGTSTSIPPLQTTQRTLIPLTIPPPGDDTVIFRHAVRKINNVSGHFEPFPYLIEPKVCTEKQAAHIVLYVAVPPNPADDLRSTIRSVWGNASKSLGIEVVFAMGRDSQVVEANGTMDVILMARENEEFGDILMANYRDSWEHLILKWWSDNHYHAFHCSHIPFMAFLDSDAVVYADSLDRFLREHGGEFENRVGCIPMGGQPAIREQDSRYFVSKDQWPNPTLHLYCSGVMIMASPEVAGKLSEAVTSLGIEYVTSFRIFDVVTGPVAKIAGVQLQTMNGLHPWLPIQNICLPSIFAMHGIKPAFRVKELFDYRRVCCATPNSTCPYDGTVPTSFAAAIRTSRAAPLPSSSKAASPPSNSSSPSRKSSSPSTKSPSPSTKSSSPPSNSSSPPSKSSRPSLPRISASLKRSTTEQEHR